MSTVIHFIGLDVHKESVAVSIAPANSTEVRFYGNIGGALDDVDRLIKKLTQPGVELRFCYEAGPTGAATVILGKGHPLPDVTGRARCPHRAALALQRSRRYFTSCPAR